VSSSLVDKKKVFVNKRHPSEKRDISTTHPQEQILKKKCGLETPIQEAQKKSVIIIR
jgi:hypothetical protein